jgi:hypothetical protein
MDIPLGSAVRAYVTRPLAAVLNRAPSDVTRDGVAVEPSEPASVGAAPKARPGWRRSFRRHSWLSPLRAAGGVSLPTQGIDSGADQRVACMASDGPCPILPHDDERQAPEDDFHGAGFRRLEIRTAVRGLLRAADLQEQLPGPVSWRL